MNKKNSRTNVLSSFGASKSEEVGVFECLKQRLVQLSFPIKEGISRTEYYGAVTKKGIPVERDKPFCKLARGI